MNHDATKSKKISFNRTTVLFVLAIFLFAMILRTPLTVVGPIISFIRDGLGISNVLAGFLTTIPLLAFAVISPFASRVARKLGMEWTLFYSIILLAVGVALRSFGTTSVLIVGTVLIGVAIAFGNVLIPSYFKLKFPLHIGLLTAVYSVSMNMSGGLGAGISYAVADTAGWQVALGFSLVFAALTLIAWLPLLRAQKVEVRSTNKNVPPKRMWRSPLAWAVALSMGLQSLIFYCSSAWLPEILISQGLEASAAGWMVSIMQLAQIPMTFLIPILAGKLPTQRPIVAFFTMCYLVGFAGILLEWTSLTLLWMIALGFAGGASFGLVLMLFTLRTKTAYEAADLSGFAQSIGYTLAAVGPVLFGYLHDATNSWLLPILLFISCSVVLSIAAFKSANNRYV